MKEETFDVSEEKVEETIETEEEVLTEEEIESLKEDIKLVENATDVLYTEKIVLDYWLTVSSAVDSIEELQDEMFARYEQVRVMLTKGNDKLDKLKEKIAPYEDD